MKSISDSVIELIIAIIIIIFVIIFFFSALKGLSYAGRPEAKFGYALAGSISFMINPVAQGISDAATIANDVLIGVFVAATVAGIVSGIKANYDENVQFLESIGYDEEAIQNINNKYLLFEDIENGGFPTDKIASGIVNAYKTTFLNPLGASLLGGTLGLDAISYLLNNLAHSMQAPILYYLVPEGVVAVNLSNIGNAQVNEMLNDLNQSYANYIEQNNICSNPTSSECQNLYATYLIAKYLFYTYGETLGQSVTISGNHNEYAILLFDYNSDYSVTLNDVLCMLEMMKYYNQVPLEVMYGNNTIYNSNNNIACQVLSNVYSSAMSSNPQDANNVYNKLLVNSYEVDQSGNANQLSSTSNNPEPNDVIIIPAIQPPDGIIIEYTYEGGNRAILLTSISGES
ncbi:putative membrane protein [Candidatus Nanobsidianus stetteri]|uniref:Putative membrane protein n=1 Tax=Nanobsidianus stetteri TaxID=1294122 RepID=R1FUA9_NANST|nr:putative membrane protein [Candidatus Nanobsidianus stetteri]